MMNEHHIFTRTTIIIKPLFALIEAQCEELESIHVYKPYNHHTNTKHMVLTNNCRESDTYFVTKERR